MREKTLCKNVDNFSKKFGNKEKKINLLPQINQISFRTAEQRSGVICMQRY